jgi:hypothetical protein
MSESVTLVGRHRMAGHGTFRVWRSQRHRQSRQDGNAATAADSRPDAAGWFAKSGSTSVDERRTASAGRGTGGRSPAARRSSAVGEKPDESEQSSQPGERGDRPHDQHLPRLLNIRSAIWHDQIRRDAEARKTVAQRLEIEPDFRISEWVARSGQWQAQMFIDGPRKAGLPE